MSTHTPSPWRARRLNASHGIYTSNGTKVCTVPASNFANIDQRRAADARLIAAAPELLAALKLATESLAGGLWDYGPGQDEHERCNEVIEQLRAAIAKAEGGAS
jgi:hypothetical protein